MGTIGAWVIGKGGFRSQVLLCTPTEPILEFVEPRPGVRLVEVEDLYVHPLRRGYGWGSELMQTALRWCDMHGWDCVLRATPHGPPPVPEFDKLKRFYAQFGFRPVRKPRLEPTFNVPRNGVMLRRQV